VQFDDVFVLEDVVAGDGLTVVRDDDEPDPDKRYKLIANMQDHRMWTPAYPDKYPDATEEIIENASQTKAAAGFDWRKGASFADSLALLAHGPIHLIWRRTPNCPIRQELTTSLRIDIYVLSLRNP